MTDGPTINLADYVQLRTPIEVALDRVFQNLGLKRLGGPSKMGWSSMAQFMACPFKYYTLHLAKSLPASAPHEISDSLEIGTLLHELLAHYYSYLAGKATFTDPEPFLQLLLDERVSGEVIGETRRLYNAYMSRWENDYLEPLAVEEAVDIDSIGHTCRYDLIANVKMNAHNVPTGAWLVDHKTQSRLEITSWQNDGQLLGQMAGWYKNKLHEKYGRLNGVIVNIIVKTKVPQFVRVILPVQKDKIRGHLRDLAHEAASMAMCRASNFWPRRRSSCLTRYGVCELFSLCSGA